ncbi:hypothetical protein ACFVZ0_18320 [Streptomyces prasinus]|uniref:hypothetical protein n=1 Tax=Streptomyces prasinus TaxID=67345 RepID=UPI00368975DF
MSRTALRICPLCEATCGLVLTVDDGKVTGARGDRDDVFSKGFVCPKGAAFPEVDSDPDRLRTPLVRRDGELREATTDAGVGRGSARATTAAATAVPPTVTASAPAAR